MALLKCMKKLYEKSLVSLFFRVHKDHRGHLGLWEKSGIR